MHFAYCLYRLRTKMERIAIASGKSEHLSQEELKARLFLKLKEDGTFNGFRAMLRNELVKHLYLVEPQKVFHQPRVENDEELFVRYPLEATNWLISEHLMRNHYDFTLSVFALESGMPSNRQNVSIGDILSFLKIDPDSAVGHRILDAYKAKEDRLFLWALLVANSTQFLLPKEDSGDQAVLPEEEDLKRVEERLRKVDDAYDFKKRALRQEDRNIGQSLAQLEQLLGTPERYGAQKFHHLHDIGLESLPDNKLHKYQGEFDQLRRTLEEQHRIKLQMLIDPEKNVQENLEKQKTAIENDFFGHRQKMLLEISNQQQREEEWENKKRFQEKMLHIEMERMESIKKTIQNREECVKQREDTHELWLEQQKHQIETSIRKKYDEKQHEFDQREFELKNFQERLDAKEVLLKEKDYFQEKAIRETNELKFDLASAKEKIKALQVENASLQSHANATTENMRLKAELHRLQLLNKEEITRSETEQIRHNTVLQEFLDRLAKPSPQALFLQQELDKLREMHQKESEAWYKQKAILESAIFGHRSQLKTYTERIKMQSRQIDILHQTIADLQRGILNKISEPEIPQKHVTFKQSTPTTNSRHEAALRSLHETPTIDFHGTYFDTSLNPSHLPPELELGVSGLLTDSYDFDYDVDYAGLTSGFQFSDGSSDETRARIKRLEEEAELLERTFKSFQHNSCSSGFLNRNVLHMAVQNMSTFSNIDQSFGKGFVASNLEDYDRKEPNNLEDFNRQVPSSTPNESLVADYIARSNPVQQSFLLNEAQGNEPKLKNPKSLIQDTTFISVDSKMTQSPISRRLSFELNEAKVDKTMDLKVNALPAHSHSGHADFIDNRVLPNSEVKLEDKLLTKSNRVLPAVDLDHVQSTNFLSSWNACESTPKTVPISLDSAWKSTTKDLHYDLDNLSTIMPADEDAMKLKMDMQPKKLSALNISREEFDQEKADAQDQDFSAPAAPYDSNDNVDKDKADSEGHLSWERTSLKSNNGDFEW